jgi:hypothetical protein
MRLFLGGRRAAVALFGEYRQVLLAALQGSDLLPRRPLEIHREPQWPNDETGDAHCYVLGHLAAFVASEILDLGVVPPSRPASLRGAREERPGGERKADDD